MGEENVNSAGSQMAGETGEKAKLYEHEEVALQHVQGIFYELSFSPAQTELCLIRSNRRHRLQRVWTLDLTKTHFYVNDRRLRLLRQRNLGGMWRKQWGYQFQCQPDFEEKIFCSYLFVASQQDLLRISLRRIDKERKANRLQCAKGEILENSRLCNLLQVPFCLNRPSPSY